MNNFYYSGGYSRGNAQGIGTWRRGDKVYRGSFANSRFHGFGTLKNRRTNSTYTGSFKNGLSDGEGIWRDGSGCIYEGSFKNGRYDGIGTRICSRTKMGYRGSFKDGEYHGEGVLITRDLSFQFPGITVWIGNFERNDLHGRGMILSYTPKRVIFDGVFNMGKVEWDMLSK